MLTFRSIQKSKNSGASSALVAIGGDGADVEAIKLACQLISPGKGILHAVYVIEVGMELPIDAEISSSIAKGEEALTQIESVASDLGFNVNAKLLQSRQTGSAIVNEAFEKQAEFIVIGTPYTEIFGTFSLGETVLYVLKNAHCKVILWRGQIPESPSKTSPTNNQPIQNALTATNERSM